MEFIKKNKKMILIIAIILVILVLLFVVVKSLMPDTRKSVWGTRTVEVDNHPISDDEINAAKEFFKSNENVVDVTYRLSGRKMIFIITVKENAPKSFVEEVSNKMLEKLSDDVKGFYDIELSYVCENPENAEYPIMAYRNKIRHVFRVTYAG